MHVDDDLLPGDAKRVQQLLVDGVDQVLDLVVGQTLGDAQRGMNDVLREMDVDPRATGRTLIKRVLDASAGGVDLRGDNSELSTDSREFGFVAPELLRGRVLLVYWPPRRFGRVR